MKLFKEDYIKATCLENSSPLRVRVSMIVLAVVLLSCTTFADKGKGGGGPLLDRPVDVVTLAFAIRALNMPVQMAFNDLHRYIKKNRPEDVNSNNLIKIFSDPKKLSDDLQTVHFVPKTEPCYDSEQHPVKASIYNMPASQICMSIPLLAAELTSENYFVKLVALGVHEESHRMGIMDEAEVGILQEQAEEFLQPKGANYLRTLNENENSVVVLKRSMQKVKDLLSAGAARAEICASFANTSLALSSVETMRTVAEEDGLALLSPADETRFLAVKTKIIFTNVYCSKPDDNDWIYNRIFKTKNVLVWKDTYQNSKYSVEVPEDIVIRKLTYGSRTNLKLEIDDVITQLSIIDNSLIKLSEMKGDGLH